LSCGIAFGNGGSVALRSIVRDPDHKPPGAASQTDVITPRKPDAGPQSAGMPLPVAPPSVSLTSHNTMNGVADENTFRSLLARLTDAIKSAIVTATTHAGGSHESAFTSGGAGP
jgi:hypothetical protein